MRRKKRKQFYIVLFVLFLVFIGFITFYMLSSNSKKQDDIGSISETKLKYSEAYYKQTKYKNELFYVVADSENYNDQSRDVVFCLSSSGIKESEVVSPYENKANTVIGVNLDETKYEELINGYDAFTADLTVTTVIIPGKEDSFSYGYCYIDDEKGEVLAKKALVDINNGIEDGSYGGTKLTTYYAISDFEKVIL